MPSVSGPLRLVAFKAPVGDILAVVSGTGNGSQVPVRVHDACLTGEVFGSLKCDCGPQLQQTLAAQTERRLGVLIYMPQEGRGIGLANKMAAYYMQEEHGLDTVDANLALGLPAESRDYSAVKYVLEELSISSILLMTNNPYKVDRLRAAGVQVDGTLPVTVTPTSPVTARYLETKRRRMAHMLPPQLAQAVAGFGAQRPVVNGESINGSAAVGVPDWQVASSTVELEASLAGSGASAADGSGARLDPAAAELVAGLRLEAEAHSGDRPFTLLSFASSMDGFIAGVRRRPDGTEEKHPVALSGAASALLTHHLRGSFDAILVGVGTVATDDPRLDVRTERAGPSPRPVVVDSDLRLPVGCRLLAHRARGGRPQTLILCTEERLGAGCEKAARRAALEAAGALVVPCLADERGRVCLRDAWGRLRGAGVRSVMVEGGAGIIEGLLRAGHRLVDAVAVTQAGVILGSGVRWATAGGALLGDVRTVSLGADAVFVGKFSPGAGPPAARE